MLQQKVIVQDTWSPIRAFAEEHEIRTFATYKVIEMFYPDFDNAVMFLMIIRIWCFSSFSKNEIKIN